MGNLDSEITKFDNDNERYYVKDKDKIVKEFGSLTKAAEKWFYPLIASQIFIV